MSIVLYNICLFFKLYIFIFCNPVFSKDSFDDFKNSIIKEALEKGISNETIKQNLYPIKTINKKVLNLYNNQPEFKITFHDYQKRNINAKRISKGKKLLVRHKNVLNQIKIKYGIPAEIIVAIWALESNYGYYTGSFNIIDALTSLSYQSKRKVFFKKELFSALEILDKKYIDSNLLKGSWAGAMGQSQFMPSSYLNYAVDFNNDNKIDIWNNHSDVFASIANYLNKHKWEKDEPWSISIIKINDNNISLKRKYVLKDLKNKIELKQDTANFSGDLMAEFKRINGSNIEENFLVFRNFFVLKKYNNSDFYALTVGSLANKIKLEK